MMQSLQCSQCSDGACQRKPSPPFALHTELRAFAGKLAGRVCVIAPGAN